VIDLVSEIRDFWPDPKQGHIQPVPPGKPETLVPESHNPALAANLAAAFEEGASPGILLAIGREVVNRWKSAGKWICASQTYYGVKSDAPWKADYRAAVTNLEISSSEGES
jgi:hypothetical protein